MKHPEGKYVLVKDPNKVRSRFALSSLQPKATPSWVIGPISPGGTFLHAFIQLKSRKQFIHPLVRQPVIRLYSVPANAFSEEEEEEGEDVDVPDLVA
jgi:hypothetical protein